MENSITKPVTPAKANYFAMRYRVIDLRDMAKEYKFILNSRNKGTCPQCQKMKCFVYWYWRGTTDIVHKGCGVCDHINGCGYKLNPWELSGAELEAIKENPNYGLDRVKDMPVIVPKPLQPIPSHYLTKSLCMTDNGEGGLRHIESNLTRWLISLPNIDLYRIGEALIKYYVGVTKSGDNIFWQVDEHGRIITGKRMAYREDGHRLKDANGNGAVGWIHTDLKRWGILPADYELEGRQTLFGMHLIRQKENDGKAVCIVESEKTALICSIFRPDFVWMATGGLCNLKREKLTTLIQQRRKIILYPDRDGVKRWTEEARKIGYSLLEINDYCVTHATEADGETADLADILVRKLYEGVPKGFRRASEQKPPILDAIHTALGLIERHDALSLLTEKFNLVLTA